MENQKPLSGYRVVELANYIAAPVCARLMSDWGADVIKIEPIGGEIFRFFGPVMSAPATEDENPLWEITNSGKRGMGLDLKAPEGLKIIHKLLENADVFVTNNRAEALEGLKLDYESLKDKYPRLVYAVVTGYGEKGPDVNAQGFDLSAFWARGGFMCDLVQPGQYPVYSPAGFGDMAVGTSLFGGVCAALLRREKTGCGDKISISLYGSSIWFSSLLITTAQKRYGNKFPKERSEGNPMGISYCCKDGEWILITLMAEHEKYWASFCKAIDRPDLIDDERFCVRTNVHNHRGELISILEEAFAKKNSDEWIEVFKKDGISHDKLRHFRDIENDEQARVNGFVQERTYDGGGKGVVTCPPIQSAFMGEASYQRGPLLGEHTEEVLKEAGYKPAEIEELKRTKIVKIY